MVGDLDAGLLAACTPSGIHSAYLELKTHKLDDLRAEGRFTLTDVLVSQGASIDEVLALSDLEADFPVDSFVESHWGRHKQKHRLVQIPIGADGVSYREFDQHIDQIGQQIARRVQTDRYIFYPFREVEILKDPPEDDRRPSKKEIEKACADGATRTLAVASVRDVVVQQILYKDVLQQPSEQLFGQLDEGGPVSYAYRPGKSPQQAAKAVLRHVRAGYTHVLDADLSKFFDSIPQEALLSVCSGWLDGNPLTYNLVRRFICVDKVPYLSYAWDARGRPLGPRVFRNDKPRDYDGPPRPGEPQRCRRDKGIPQGGVISGLLANLYLHPLDEWIKRELAPRFDLRYVRYADDFVVLARSQDVVLQVHGLICERVETPPEDGGLGLKMHRMNPENPSDPNSKTKYVDLAVSPLHFVGFEILGAEHGAQLRIKPKNVERFVKRWKRLVESERDLIDILPDPRDRLKKVIQSRLRPKVVGYVHSETCSVCGKKRRVTRSWIYFYRCTTDPQQVLELDQRLRKIVYAHFRETLPGLKRIDLTSCKMPSLIREYHRARRVRGGCKCGLGADAKRPSSGTPAA